MGKLQKNTILSLTLMLMLILTSGTIFGMDHSAFINESFDSGPEVTEKCMSCHQEATEDALHSMHFQWKGEMTSVEGREDEELGKRLGDVNGFCIAVPSNEQRCNQCHAGYGAGTEDFSYEDETRVDCLACHAEPELYNKPKADWGNPGEDVDLTKAAQSVGEPSRENCLTCHANGGGGNNVKQGDIYQSLISPDHGLDVHMDAENTDMQCQECHTTENHQITGRSIHAVGNEGKVTCAECHTTAPHENSKLNDHTDAVSCQTCHIPKFAKEHKTKVKWDWSTVGEDDATSAKKGTFVYDKNITPTYKWYNGKSENYVAGDKINQDGPTIMAQPVGDINDADAKIYPFKEFRSNQPVDTEYNHLLTPKLMGGVWKTLSWEDKWFEQGAEANGIKYSGEYDFEKTITYLGLNHEVAPTEEALECASCHMGGDRLDWEALGYDSDPMMSGGRDVE